MPKKESTAKDFRDELWKILIERAKKHDGRVVAQAFREGSQDVWDAGVDEAWEKLKQPSTAGAKRTFDATWVAATGRRVIAQVLLLEVALPCPADGGRG